MKNDTHSFTTNFPPYNIQVLLTALYLSLTLSLNNDDTQVFTKSLNTTHLETHIQNHIKPLKRVRTLDSRRKHHNKNASLTHFKIRLHSKNVLFRLAKMAKTAFIIHSEFSSNSRHILRNLLHHSFTSRLEIQYKYIKTKHQF